MPKTSKTTTLPRAAYQPHAKNNGEGPVWPFLGDSASVEIPKSETTGTGSEDKM